MELVLLSQLLAVVFVRLGPRLQPSVHYCRRRRSLVPANQVGFSPRSAPQSWLLSHEKESLFTPDVAYDAHDKWYRNSLVSSMWKQRSSSTNKKLPRLPGNGAEEIAKIRMTIFLFTWCDLSIFIKFHQLLEPRRRRPKLETRKPKVCAAEAAQDLGSRLWERPAFEGPLIWEKTHSLLK